MMTPEDRIEGSSSRIHHVAVKTLGNLGLHDFEVGIDPAREVVNEIMHVFQGAEELIAPATAAKIEKVADAENALHVIRRRVGLENQILVAAGPALPVPERIDLSEHRLDRLVACGVVAVLDAGGLEETRA